MNKETQMHLLEENNELKAKLEFLLEHDTLTGLYHKNYFYQVTQKMIEDNPNIRYYIACIDVERFKMVNAYCGQREGNKVLQFIARMIEKEAQGHGTYGRIEGDVFSVCLPMDANDIELRAAKFQEELRQYPLDIDITMKFGIYVIDEPTVSVSQMCDWARVAANTVKGNYLEHIAYYDERLKCRFLEEQDIINDMDVALKDRQFEVHIQPKYDMRDESIIGGEALVRWRHPKKGLIVPKLFIPVFENNGFIFKLDEYIWESVCQTIRRWIDERGKVVPISVNVSRVDLYNNNLEKKLLDLIKKYKLNPQFLELEITESAYSEHPEQLIEIVAKLHEAGFKILMDDFGSGYSSLNMLKDVPVDILKLDMKFLEESPNFSRGSNILNSIIRMSNWLDLPVIAEGVESVRQVEFLRSIGCEYAQGYFYSRALAIQDFENLLDGKPVREEYEPCQSYLEADFNEFWKPNTQVDVLFNAQVEPVLVLEYCNGNLEVIQTNMQCYKMLTTIDLAYKGYRTCIQKGIYQEDQWKFKEYLQLVIENKNDRNCLIRWGNEEVIKHFELRLCCILQKDNRYLLYGTIKDATNELLKEEAIQRAESIMNQMQGGIFLLEWDGIQFTPVYANEPLFRILGYTRVEYLELTEDNFWSIVYEVDREALKESFQLILNGQDSCKGNFRIVKKNGEICWCQTLVNRIGKKKKHPVLLVLITDITKEKELERALRESEQRFADAFRREQQLREQFKKGKILDIEVDVTDEKVIKIDEKAYLELKIKEDVTYNQLIAMLIERIGPSWQEEILLKFQKNALQHAFKNNQFEITSQVQIYRVLDNKKIWASLQMQLIRNRKNNHIIGNLFIRDIDEKKKVEILLRQKAELDPLTKLYNREALESKIEGCLKNQIEQGIQSAFFMIDIDNFKAINDSHGHVVGDRILYIIAQRLKMLFRKSDVVGRIGGDEFIVFMSEICSVKSVHIKAKQVCDTLNINFQEDGVCCSTTCSIGVALSPMCGKSYRELYIHADSAAYHAKRGGKNSYQFKLSDN
ncbi:EAL domain-containing protein [Lachnospiraceae bacterium LCP25S3_G4]